MNEFQFEIPQKIIFGKNSLKKLPDLLKGNGARHVMLVSDRGLEKAGAVQKVRDLFEQEGTAWSEYLDVKPNPSVRVVNELLEAYQSSGSDCMVALGGGSTMDVAKAAGVLAVYGGEITAYEGADKVPGPIVPIIAIPTTAGTGSEVTAFSVITDEEREYKLTIFSYKLIPQYALLDPEFIMSVPAAVAAACGMDALIHAMESYLSLGSSPFTDGMAEKAMELIGGNIRRYVANRRDEEAAGAMLLGSNFAGIAFAWSRLGNVHAMSHPVSAMYHVPHGVANAILLPYILEYNRLADHGRYEKIYNYVSGKRAGKSFTSEMLVEAITALNEELGIPADLSAVGVKAESIDKMSADAMKSGNILVNPRMTTIEDVKRLYRKALGEI